VSFYVIQNNLSLLELHTLYNILPQWFENVSACKAPGTCALYTVYENFVCYDINRNVC